jgi:hypothetical protein
MHFTYEPTTSADLLQGDVIRRTEAVEALLKTVHPHYYSAKNYRFFIVLTQSCDLVRRDGAQCKSRYITIAAVRPLRLALDREIQKLQTSSIERKLRICNESRQIKLVQFMERLLNNNEDDYFYLHREPSVEMHEDHCAFLRLSITVKSELHYATLFDARVLSLKESFQHKLGYLVGTLFSRIGTEDWVPKNCTGERFKELTEQPLADPNLVLWLNKEVHRKVMQDLKQLADPDEDDLKRAIAKAVQTRENKKIEVIKIVSTVLQEMKLPDNIVSTVRQRLENRPDFKVALK